MSEASASQFLHHSNHPKAQRKQLARSRVRWTPCVLCKWEERGFDAEDACAPEVPARALAAWFECASAVNRAAVLLRTRSRPRRAQARVSAPWRAAPDARLPALRTASRCARGRWAAGCLRSFELRVEAQIRSVQWAPAAGEASARAKVLRSAS